MDTKFDTFLKGRRKEAERVEESRLRRSGESFEVSRREGEKSVAAGEVVYEDIIL